MKRLAFLPMLLPTIAFGQTANLWIDTNGGTCTRQSTAGFYVDAAACSSMQTALTACTPGDTIRMKAGTYGGQTITASKSTPGCTIIAETTTTIGSLVTNGNWYEIQNINGSGWNISNQGVGNITCRGCNFSGSSNTWQRVGSASSGEIYGRINWIGGSGRNFTTSTEACYLCVRTKGDQADGNQYTVSDIVVDGVIFDNIRTTTTANHFEVIRVDGNINGFTNKNSTFTNIEASSGIYLFSTFLGIKPRNIVLENNFFGSPGSAPVTINMSFQNKSDCSDWTMRYNTFLGGTMNIPDEVPVGGGCASGVFTNVVWVGNLMPRAFGYCQGTAFRYNVGYGASGSACSGTGNTVTTTAGANLSGFYLQAGSTAINAGAPVGADCIAADHDGSTRPSGANCDAGAHEFGATPIAPPGNFRTVEWMRRFFAGV